MSVYSSRKSLKEVALPTLNLPRTSANANTTNNLALNKIWNIAVQEEFPI